MTAKPTTSTFLRALDRRLAYLTAVRDGLRGAPFAWNSAERSSGKAVLKELGITLVTASWLAERGYVLNRGARAVGSVYFPAPISRSCPVYVLECQAWLKEPGKLAKVEAKARERRAGLLVDKR